LGKKRPFLPRGKKRAENLGAFSARKIAPPIIFKMVVYLGVKISVIKNRRSFLQLDTRELMSHINLLIGEHAYILTNHPFNMKEEDAWKHTRAAEIAAGDKMVVIAQDGKCVAGICEVKRGKGKERYNMNFSMSVDERYRGHGLGKAMVKRAIAEGKKAWKPHKIFLFYEEGNAPARQLYESLGFHETVRLKGYIYHYGKFIDRIMMEIK